MEKHKPMDNFTLGYELYHELKRRYNGNLAKANAYITNAINAAMLRPREENEVYNREAFVYCADHLHAEIVERYMEEHGYKRPEGSGRNIWEEAATDPAEDHPQK